MRVVHTNLNRKLRERWNYLIEFEWSIRRVKSENIADYMNRISYFHYKFTPMSLALIIMCYIFLAMMEYTDLTSLIKGSELSSSSNVSNSSIS